MDPSEDSPMDDEAALQEFNDPFQAISENFVRRRHAETDVQRVSIEDEQMLLTRMDAQDLEGRVMQDACLQMVAMNLVPQEVLAKMQEDFEFEKLDFTAAPALSAEAIQQAEDLAENLELEELIAQLESGKNEDDTPLDANQVAELERRILLLDSMIRRKRAVKNARRS